MATTTSPPVGVGNIDGIDLKLKQCERSTALIVIDCVDINLLTRVSVCFATLPAHLTQGMIKGEMLFVVGLPGCGKSTFYHTLYKETHTLLDSDVFKKTHPRHDELACHPEGQTELHKYGKEQRVTSSRSKVGFDKGTHSHLFSSIRC